MIVGRPSLKKTPALKESIKMLEQLEIDAGAHFEAEMRQWASDEIIRSENEKILKNNLKKALQKNGDPQQIALQILDEHEAGSLTPIRQRFIVNDVTVEKLGELLKENPNGLLINRDELSGFLMSLEKSGHECDRAFYLEAWNGDGRFTYDRIGRGTVAIESACLSIIGTIQPGPLTSYLREALDGGEGDDGFLQRFQMAVYPDSPSSFMNVDRSPDIHSREMVKSAFSRLASITAESVGAQIEQDDKIPNLRFSEAAQQGFNEWLTQLENRLLKQDMHPILEAHLAKYRSLVPSLALLIHLVDHGVGAVTLSSFQQACAWAEYLETHACRIYGMGLSSDVYLAEILLAHIKKGKLANPFSIRDVQRRHWSALSTNQDVRSAIEILEDADILQKVITQTLGRSKEEYYIHPSFLQEVANDG